MQKIKSHNHFIYFFPVLLSSIFAVNINGQTIHSAVGTTNHIKYIVSLATSK